MHRHNYFMRESFFWKYLKHETLSSMFNWVDIQWKLNLVPSPSIKKRREGKRRKEKDERM